MTTLEKIKAEIQKVLNTERDFTSENAKAQALALNWVLELFDKYAEQEPTDTWSIKDVADTFKKHGLIVEQVPCENCCNGNQTEKAKLCQKSYLAGMGHKQDLIIEAYRQVCKERDIAIEQLHELGYEWGQKIEPCDDVVSRQAVLDELNKWEWQELYLPIHFKENIIDVVPSVRPQEPCKDAYDKVLAYLKANVDDFPDFHEAIEAVLKMKGGE